MVSAPVSELKLGYRHSHQGDKMGEQSSDGRVMLDQKIPVTSLVTYSWANLARGTKGNIIAWEKGMYDQVQVVVEWENGHSPTMKQEEISFVIPGEAPWHV